MKVGELSTMEENSEKSIENFDIVTPSKFPAS